MKPRILSSRRAWKAASVRHVVTLGFAAALTFALGTASANETKKKESASATKQPAATKPAKATATPKQATQLLTGSHIPTHVKRMGNTADTAYPICIIDAKEIARSGAGSVAGALKRCPAVR